MSCSMIPVWPKVQRATSRRSEEQDADRSGKMPVSIILEIGNGLGESDDLFGLCVRQCQVKSIVRQGRASDIEDSGFFLHRCRA